MYQVGDCLRLNYTHFYTEDICMKTKVWWDVKPCSWASGSLSIAVFFGVRQSVHWE